MDAITLLEITFVIYIVFIALSLVLGVIVLYNHQNSSGVTGVLDPQQPDIQYILSTSGEVIEEEQGQEDQELEEIKEVLHVISGTY